MACSTELERQADQIMGIERRLRSVWANSDWLRGDLRSIIEDEAVEATLRVSAQYRRRLEGFRDRARSIELLLSM